MYSDDKRFSGRNSSEARQSEKLREKELRRRGTSPLPFSVSKDTIGDRITFFCSANGSGFQSQNIIYEALQNSKLDPTTRNQYLSIASLRIAKEVLTLLIAGAPGISDSPRNFNTSLSSYQEFNTLRNDAAKLTVITSNSYITDYFTLKTHLLGALEGNMEIIMKYINNNMYSENNRALAIKIITLSSVYIKKIRANEYDVKALTDIIKAVDKVSI